MSGDASVPASGERPVEVDVTGTTLRATDIAGNVVALDLTGWDALSWSHTFEEPIDAAVSGRVSEIRYDLWNGIRFERFDGELTLAGGDGPVVDDVLAVDYDEDRMFDLPTGEYGCICDEEIFTRIRFDGEATVRNRSYGSFTISFPHPTPVTFGFKSTVEVPRSRLTVEPTTAGIAAGITSLASALQTTGSSRVHRNYRAYPPLFEIGTETQVPDNDPETGIEVIVPDSLSAVYTASTLAFYLGATLRPDSGTSPRIQAAKTDLSYEIPTEPTFAAGVRDVLRRTFFLELLVDWLGPDDPTVEEYRQLRRAGIDLVDCPGRSLAERVTTYLSVPDDPVDEILPEWPYRMTLEPDPAYAPAIPHLLHDLAAVDTPETAAVDGARVRSGADDAETTPRAQLSAVQQLHGALGEFAGETDFRARLEAYENRLAALERNREAVSVVVVTGPSIDPDRAEQFASTYAEGGKDVSTIVDSLAAPTVAELTASLSDGVDFLHYVGSCTDGFACRDGTVDPGMPADADVLLAQLDGAGSDELASKLIAGGTVAAVCRPRDHDGQSAWIIGRLVLYGQSIATAAQCSRLVEPDTAPSVVGDGTHRFVAKWRPTGIHSLRTRSDGSLAITVVPFSVDPVGTHWRESLETEKHLMPSSYSLDIEPPSFNEYLANAIEPIYTTDGFYMPEEARQLLYPIA